MGQRGPRHRSRKVGAAIALSLAAALSVTPPALGAGDPVATGTFELKLSRAFKKQLKGNGVTMTPKAFSIKEGEIDPVTGDGTLTLKGKLRFKHDGEKVVYKKVTARLGSNGVLKGNGVKLFKLSGARVVRNGFGVDISAVKVKFLGGAAKKINRKLDLHSLHKARAGVITVSEQPQTVEVTGGAVHFVPNPTLDEGAGTVASKLLPHCINFIDGNTAIAPGVKKGTTTKPFYDFPITGGTVSPAGAGGVIDSAGGIKVENNNDSSPSADHCDTDPPPLASLDQTDFAFNLLENYVSSHVLIGEEIPGTVPAAGDHGAAPGSDLDPSNATVSADPVNHTVRITGLVVRFNGGSALYLNQTFAQPDSTYNPSMQFAAGDLFGIVDLTVTTR
jgi:hypothetical protein